MIDVEPMDIDNGCFLHKSYSGYYRHLNNDNRKSVNELKDMINSEKASGISKYLHVIHEELKVTRKENSPINLYSQCHLENKIIEKIDYKPMTT